MGDVNTKFSVLQTSANSMKLMELILLFSLAQAYYQYAHSLYDLTIFNRGD